MENHGNKAENLSCGGGGSGGFYAASYTQEINSAYPGNSYSAGKGTASIYYNNVPRNNGSKTTGGLLICYGESIIGNGKFKSTGTNARVETPGGTDWAGSGGSGGGCIAIIFKRECQVESRQYFIDWWSRWDRRKRC